MKCLLFVVALAAAVAAESFYYISENDYLDVDKVIADRPLFQSFVDCFLDRAPCTSLTTSYKRIIQDSITTACERCNVPQRQGYAKFLWGLKTYYPQDYINYRQKYDPTGTHFDRLEAVLANYLEFKTPTKLPVPQRYHSLNNKQELP